SPIPLGRRVSTLLDFETGNDLTFVATQPAAEVARIDTAIARAGARCMVLAGGATSVLIKTPTLLQGRPFPADWLLLGAFVLTDRPVTVTASYETPGKPSLTRTIAIAPGVWTPVMIDLT